MILSHSFTSKPFNSKSNILFVTVVQSHSSSIGFFGYDSYLLTGWFVRGKGIGMDIAYGNLWIICGDGMFDGTHTHTHTQTTKKKRIKAT